jgi:hypothetical protein
MAVNVHDKPLRPYLLHLNSNLNHSKLNELLPRRQQFDRAVFQAQSRKMSYHPCPGEVFIKK